MRVFGLIPLFFVLLIAAFAAATDDQEECPGIPSSANVVLLLDNNGIVSFPAGNWRKFHAVRLSGVEGELLAIDGRPRGQTLWGISNRGGLYQIDLQSHSATLISNLSQPLTGGRVYGMDFNPTVDRLRLVASNNNFRVNVDDGNVTVDLPIQYASSDVNSGRVARVTGVAYTNSTDGATATVLYGIDRVSRNLLNLVTINPPNNGTLNTVGSLGIRGDRFLGFDIYTSQQGCNTALVVTDNRFYFVDLQNGSAVPTWRKTSRWIDDFLCNHDVLGLAVL